MSPEFWAGLALGALGGVAVMSLVLEAVFAARAREAKAARERGERW